MNNTPGVRAAKVLSYALHPLLMPTLGMVILFQVNTYLSLIMSQQAKGLLYLLVFFNTFLIPLAVSFFMLKRGFIRSLHMDTPQERRIPLLVTAFAYTFTYYLLRKIPLTAVIYVSMMGAILAVIIQTIVNLKWKMSAHMTGFGGLLGIVFGLSYRMNMNLTWLIVLLFLVGGLLAAARLKITDHTPGQIYWGFLNGFLCQLLLFMIF